MLFIEANFLTENVMASELWFIAKIVSMKVNGLMIIVKEKAWKNTVMVTNMKVILKEEKLMVKESIIGPMEKCTMANGKTELRKDMACGEVFLVIHILDNGKTAKLMDMGFINGKTEIDTKEVGSTVLSTAKLLICLQTVMFILVTTLTVNQTEQVFINGKMVVSTPVSLKKDSSMASANGNKILINLKLIITRANILVRRKMAKELLLGKMEISITEIISMMKEINMEK